MPTDENSLRRVPPQFGHSVSGSSVNFWTASVCSPHAVHMYSYVGTTLTSASTLGLRLLIMRHAFAAVHFTRGRSLHSLHAAGVPGSGSAAPLAAIWRGHAGGDG